MNVPTMSQEEAAEEIQRLQLLVYRLSCELRIYHRTYNLLSPKIDDLLQEAFEEVLKV